MRTRPFEFEHNGHRLRGVIDYPADHEPVSGVIMTHGHGKTNVAAESDSLETRKNFTAHDVACCRWDRAGCGASDGAYDHYQRIEDSAIEAVKAAEIFHRRTGLSRKRIGFSGASRACWINVLAIQHLPEAAFLIAVSGAGGEDNFPYLLETNLRMEGRSEEQVKIIRAELKEAMRSCRTGGTYADFCQALKTYQADPFVSFMIENGFGFCTEEEFLREQGRHRRGEYSVDGNEVQQFPAFLGALRAVICPTLAIFGELDSNVNWKETLSLYRENLSDLTVHTFPDANHSLVRCKTGSIREHILLSSSGLPPNHWKESDKIQTDWLCDRGLAQARNGGG